MKAIILAAGRGSRLLSLTEDRPKCLVEAGGKPLLAWQIEALRGAGIQDILVVGGYLGHMLHGPFVRRHNPDWDKTNMLASLLVARDWLQAAPCVISYADIVYPARAVARLLDAPGEIALLYDVNWRKLWTKRFDNPASDAESFTLDAGGNVTGIGQKGVPLESIQGQYMGLLKITPAGLEWIEALLAREPELRARLDMTAPLARLLAEGRKIASRPWDGPWCEVDTPEDLRVAEQILREETW